MHKKNDRLATEESGMTMKGSRFNNYYLWKAFKWILVNSWFWTDVILSFLLQSIDNMRFRVIAGKFCSNFV